MHKRLSIALAQINTSENVITEIRQITYSLYWAKEITKQVCNNAMNSIKLQNRTDAIFIDSEDSKTSDPHWRVANLSEKINLKWSNKYVALSSKSIKKVIQK